jgi:hypothetical protein
LTAGRWPPTADGKIADIKKAHLNQVRFFYAMKLFLKKLAGGG